MVALGGARLADLASHVLTHVADALAVVGLRRPLGADFGSKLPDELLLVRDDHNFVVGATL